MFLGCTLMPKLESIWRIRTARAKPLMWLRERRWTSERTLGPVLCCLSPPERQTRPAGNDQQGAARRVSSRREGLDVWALPGDPFSKNLSYPGINKSANSHVSPVHGLGPGQTCAVGLWWTHGIFSQSHDHTGWCPVMWMLVYKPHEVVRYIYHKHP